MVSEDPAERDRYRYYSSLTSLTWVGKLGDVTVTVVTLTLSWSGSCSYFLMTFLNDV